MNLISILWIFGCLLFTQLLLADDSSIEYKIKAGYLYNTTKFITWNLVDTNVANVCIVGEDPFGKIIDPIKNRLGPESLPIKLFRYKSLENLANQPHCHIIFVSSSIKDSLNQPNFDNTLVVGESDDFIERGGMIGLINRQKKIKLQCNLERINKAGLRISAKLIEVCDAFKGGSNINVVGPFGVVWVMMAVAVLILAIAGYFVYKQFNKS
jgi:hypothetical protein